MKKLLVAILALSLLSLPTMASNGGGKKKAKKKAKTECKVDKSCKKQECDPKNCNPKDCDPKCCLFPTCAQEEKTPAETKSAEKQ